MTSRSVYWGDGLFLRPHHFQLLERSAAEAVAESNRFANPNCYGVLDLKADAASLVNWRISFHSGMLRFRDGTVLDFPDHADLPDEPIPRDIFASASDRVLVSIGVPNLRRGVSNSNVKSEDGTPESRYMTHFEEVQDENAAGNAEELEFRRLSPRILIGEDAARGFDAVPVMRLKLGTQAEAAPELDRSYMPPMLRFRAWGDLKRLHGDITNRFAGEADRLASQMKDRGVAFASGNKEDFERILKLHALNDALGGLSPMLSQPHVHPQNLYEEFCRAAGLIAIFREDRKCPAFPAYDHDDLGQVFAKLDRLLQLEAPPDTEYETRPFQTRGQQMSVRLEKEWLDATWSFFIGVKSTAESSHVREMLSEAGLNLKVGSSEEVDDIYRSGRRGVRLVAVGDPPRAFPREDWHYYQVQRDRVWQAVEKTLNLGIRFNEENVKHHEDSNRIEATDERDSRIVSMEFTLFAINAA